MSLIRKLSFAIALSFLSSFRAQGQWTPVESGTTRNLNGISLLDSGVAYAVGDAGAILKSTDAGATWSALVSGTTESLHDVYFFDADEGIAVGDNGLILRTSDGGTTWTSVPSGVHDALRSVAFNGANGICGGDSQDILYSTDSGASWRVAQSGFFGGGFNGAQMISPTVGFVAGQNSIFQPFVGATVDGGASWTFHNFYFDGNEGTCDDIFFFDDLTGVVSGILFDFTGALARTTNGGTDWTSTIYPTAEHGIDFPTAQTGFAVGNAGSILQSSDAGVSWSGQDSGTSAELFDVDFASDAETGIAVGSGGVIVRTTNGGAAGDFALIAASSKAGKFKIDLPLTGSPGVECRSGGPNHSYSIIFDFNHSVSSVGDVQSSCGSVVSAVVDPHNHHHLLVSLTGVTCDGEEVVVTAESVQDGEGGEIGSAAVTMGLLVGDVNGDGSVDRSDLQITRKLQGAEITADNFRADINGSGRINWLDIKFVKANFGTTLAP